MKIISLIPVKNEEWILNLSLRQLSEISDEVIILNDNSSDKTTEVAKVYKNCTVLDYKEKENFVNMSRRRNVLLEQGRKMGGTHFVMLDADECFSDDFQKDIRNTLSKLSKGQALCLPWTFVFKYGEQIVIDPKLSIIKDFIFCDDGVSLYEDKALSEGRTPAIRNNYVIEENKKFVVYHFQYYAEKRNQLKQIWYRCNELIEGKRSAYRINATYLFTKTFKPQQIINVDDAYIKANLSSIKNSDDKFLLKRITDLFDLYGIKFFEKLDIWHMKETMDIFIDKMKRDPKPSIPSKIVMLVNEYKNIILNKIIK
jgi:glycosyltransferase involved in cell wall biosynthesis